MSKHSSQTSSDGSSHGPSNKKSNRLATSKSLYLRQHQHNPVEWYEWGDAAFEAALKRDVPIFLSIGYSTCHWCHVMAHECFEDEDVAAILNRDFVAIKVDREERPDIDHLYMSVCQVYTRSGGWPLTIVMTPQKQPFFAGTYFAKTSSPHRIGLMELLPKITDLWHTKRAQLEHDATQIITGLVQESFKVGVKVLPPDVVYHAFQLLKAHYDPVHGGFSDAPKFPSPHTLLFLLMLPKVAPDLPLNASKESLKESLKESSPDLAKLSEECLSMVSRTLIAMRLGGIYDQVGGGFHRYSTDAEWKTPHFEKMLYDQALLLNVYAMAYQSTENPFFLDVCRDVMTYLTRDMKAENGLFYCAQDADSEGGEGAFYLWSYDELARLLSPEELAFCTKYWGIQPSGNSCDEATGVALPLNILHSKESGLSAVSEGSLSEPYARIRSVLLKERAKRPHPDTDMKCLADWNGLLLWGMSALAEVADSFLGDVTSLADAIQSQFIQPSGRVFHVVSGQDAYIDGFLSDYAALAVGFYKVFCLTGVPRYLNTALSLVTVANELFWDNARGGFFISGTETQDVLIRQKETYDGAIPSSNSLLLYVMTALSSLSYQPVWVERTGFMITVFSELILAYPAAYTFWMVGVLCFYSDTRCVLVSGKSKSDVRHASQAVRRKLNDSVRQPFSVVIELHEENHAALSETLPWLSDVSLEKGVEYRMCQHHTCGLATTDADTLFNFD